MYDVVAIGNPVYDIIITPFVRSKGRVLSGCSVNALLALRRLGFNRVALIGSIGKDYLYKIKEDLRNFGIRNFALIEADTTCGFELVYDEKGDRTLKVLGLGSKITSHDIPDEYLKAKYIILGPVLYEIDYSLIEYVATASDAKVLLDPQGLTRRIGKDGFIEHFCDCRSLRRVAQYLDFIKPNEKESLFITGEVDPFRAAKLLVEWGAEVGIVTLAERGSVAFDGELFYRVPAYRTVAVDPTGAGDVYAGALIAGLLEGYHLPEALLLASAAASIKVEHCGPTFPVTRAEAERRYYAIRPSLEVYE
ncbi:MAG: ribokinase, partial [Thermoprotei archaeon]